MRFKGVKVTCAIDKVDCTEYKYESLQSKKPENVQECFVSAETKHTIQFHISLEGFWEVCQADLVVDGIIRDTAVLRKVNYGTRWHTLEHGMWKEGRGV